MHIQTVSLFRPLVSFANGDLQGAGFFHLWVTQVLSKGESTKSPFMPYMRDRKRESSTHILCFLFPHFIIVCKAPQNHNGGAFFPDK